MGYGGLVVQWWDIGFDSGFCFLCARVSDYYGGGIYGSQWCWVLKG